MSSLSEERGMAICSNTLHNEGPIECIQFVLKAIADAKLQFCFYSRTMQKKELTELLNSLKITSPVIIKFRDEAEVYVDCDNLGGFPGWMQLFYMLVENNMIPQTQENIDILQDEQFWSTGKRSYGLILPGSKIIT